MTVRADNCGWSTPFPTHPASQPARPALGHSSATFDFGQASHFLRLPVSSYDLQISLRSANDDSPVRFQTDRTTVDSRHQSTLYVLGKLGDHSATSLLIETADTRVPPGQARLRFIDAATGTPPISVYLLGDGAEIGRPQALTSLEFPGGGTPMLVPAGDYELVLTARGDPADVLFDSGTSSLHLSGGSRRQIAALNSPDRPGGSPFQILVLDRHGKPGHLLHQSHP
jgi:hypothetical protein